LLEPEESTDSGALSASRLLDALRRSDGFVDNHARHRLVVFFLFRCVNFVRGKVHRNPVRRVLYVKVLEFPVVVGIVFMKDGDRTAVAGYVDSAEAGLVAFEHRDIAGNDRILFRAS
jgi:hypothetical protein